ncbi:MAG: hypothetical protein ABIO92_04760 [Chloroflexia bacterium]
MIKLKRERTATAIPPDFTGEGALALRLLLLQGKRDGQLEFNSAIWKKAKKQLKKEAAGKCAYCEAETSVVAHGDVEHFRPKGGDDGYWYLAYCYDNYTYSCQICNQTYKKDKFPIFGTKLKLKPPLLNPYPANATPDVLRATILTFAPDPLVDNTDYPMATFLERTTKEKPTLIDPYMVDPEPFFKWEVDNVNKEVYIRPRNNTVKVKRTFLAVDEYLGLNREELCRVRWLTFRSLAVIRMAYEATDAGDPLRAACKDFIELAISNEAPFAGMARYFVNKEWHLDLS